MKTKTNMTREFARRAVMTLLAVLTTSSVWAARTPPRYYIECCQGGLGDVCVSGWVYDPYHGDIALDVVVSTVPDVENDPEDEYEDIHSEWFPESTEFVYREDVNAQHNLTGNHGFRVKLSITDACLDWFGEETEKTLYVKIYARTFEYNENNPYCKDYEFLLNAPYTAVSVKKVTGFGTSESPYVISNAAEWDAIADVLSDAGAASFYKGCFYRLADMVNDEDDYDNSTPVTKMWGTSNSPFAGNFDGMGKTLNVNVSATDEFAAPFSFVNGASIHDLKVSGTVRGTYIAGGIVGVAVGTLSMDRCVFDGTISDFQYFAGGLVGWCEGLTLNIHNCLFKGSFSPGSGGKYHPIACKNEGAIVKAPAAGGVYYLNDVLPSEGLGNNVVFGAEGFAVSTTFEDDVWDEPVTAIDGQTYYAAHFNGQKLPYEYGFENNDLYADGWTKVTHYSKTRIRKVQSETWPYPSGNYCFDFDSDRYGFGEHQYLISPEFNGHSGITLSFKFTSGYWILPVTLQVGYSTTTNDVDAFDWEDPITSWAGENWTLYEKDFPKGTKYLSVRMGADIRFLFLDDFKFLVCDSPSPTNLCVDDFTECTVSLSWEAPIADRPVMGYAYQYKKVSEERWSDEASVTGTSVTIDGLASTTDYDFRVKAIFGEQKASIWLPTQFATALQLPYECGFENGMTGWSMVDRTFILGNCCTGIVSETAFEGGSSFLFLSGGSVQYLISPLIFSSTKFNVSFYYMDVRSNSGLNFQVGYSTQTSNISDFTWGDVVSATNDLWTLYEQTFPENTKYVAIRYNSKAGETGNYERLYFDDFSFTEYSPYPGPNSLTVNNLTDQSATLVWTAPQGATRYAYQYKRAADDIWPDEVETNATSVTLNGLEANTTYDFRVKALNAGGNASNYVKQVLFTEGPAVSAFPFTQGFEDGMGGWRVVGLKSHITNYYKHEGKHGFSFENLGYSYNRCLISPQLNATDPIKVSFYHVMPNDESLFSFFSVGYSTTSKDLNDFTWTKQIPTYSYWSEYSNVFPEGTKYVAIRWGGRYGFSLDNFTFELTDSPSIELQDVVVNDVTSSSADISWTGGVDNFQFRYREQNWFYQGFESFNGGFGHGQQGWKAFEENGLFIRSGLSSWQIGRSDGDNYAVSINYRTLINQDNTTAIEILDLDDWLFTPKIPLTGTLTFKAHFDPFSNEYDEEYDKAEVLICTNSDPYQGFYNPSSRQVIGRIAPRNNIFDPDYFTISLDDFDDFKGKEGYIAFRHKSKHESWFDVDDVCIYRTTNDWTTIETTERNIKLTGLQPLTGYEYQIRSLLSGNSSSWSNMASFTTENVIPLASESDINDIADGNTHDVTLQGYTLYRNRVWNTLCLPFNLVDGDESDGISFSGTPLQGATVKALSGSDFSGNKLTLTFTDVSSSGGHIEAGKPYIVRWPDGAGPFLEYTENPVFYGVTVVSNDLTPATFSEGQFTGTYAPIADTNEMLLDALNAGNGAFHAALGFDRSCLGDDFVGWYTDAAMSMPASTIPFDADGNVTLYAGWGVELADASDNTATIEAVVGSGKTDNKVVVINGRTLSRDGEWNTLCLPFSMNATQMASSSLADATIMELNGETSNLTGGTLTLNFTPVSPSGEQGALMEAGRPYLVRWTNGAKLVISSDADWTAFAQRVENGERFAGMNVLLDADISVSTMVGTADHPFCGTFDGNGHTLNVSIGNDGADYAAPFRYIHGATIRNVRVEGSVNGGDYCAGLVGAALGGTNSIRNCWMAASVSGQSNIGGVLGHGNASATTISNCYLTGSLNANYIGVFCGGGSAGGRHTIETCWANGSYPDFLQVVIDEDHPYTGDINLIRADGGTVSVNNCKQNIRDGLQGSYTGFEVIIVIGGGGTDDRFVTFLGSQWALNDNGGLTLKPSADIDATDIENPVFPGVTIGSNAPAAVTFTGGKFLGSYNPVALTTDDLLFSDNSTVGSPADATTLNACRAYFQLNDAGADVTTVVLNFNDSAVLPGDVNGDGKVTPADAIMILYHYFGVVQNGFNAAAADLNGDNNITPADAIETLYKYFGAGSNGARAIRTTVTCTKDPE